MNCKKWFFLTLSLLLGGFFLLGGLTALVDPYFHYHAPLPGLAYELSQDRQRYINDGISKHFTYDALLTGTSMMENARSSTFDALFGVSSIKVPYEGSALKETDENLRRAIAANPELKLVFRCLDYFILIHDKDEQLYPEELFPRYLYDDNPLNDSNYLFNKTVLLENTLPTLLRTLQGQTMTDFDSYSRMDASYFGMSPPEGGFAPPNRESHHSPPEMLRMVRENVRQNARQTALEHPEIQFYYVISPYSLLYWNRLRADGLVDANLDLEQEAVAQLVDLENVHIFTFYDCPEIIGALDCYMDECHYNADILDLIFQYMAEEKHRLYPETYTEAFERARTLFKEGNLAALVS